MIIAAIQQATASVIQTASHHKIQTAQTAPAQQIIAVIQPKTASVT
jgi:hypothetical protein